MNLSQLLRESKRECNLMDKYNVSNKMKVYPFTTENISGYIPYFDLKGKSLLTVGSSGDQVINARLHGCEDITLYDICPDAKYYYYLKAAGVISLSRDEFLNFFRFKHFDQDDNDNIDVFNLKIFEKIARVLKELDHDSYIYYRKLLNRFNGVTVRKTIFESDEHSTPIIVNCNDYLKSHIAYDSTKELLKKTRPNFIEANIFDIKNDKEYDNIWLSNIAARIPDEASFFIEELLNTVYPCLSKNGKMLFSYIYRINEEYECDMYPIFDKTLMETLLKGHEHNIEKFEGVFFRSNIETNQIDGAYILRK